MVSPLVVQCVAYLNREHVLKEEGLFRIPGDLAAIKKIRQQFIAGTDAIMIMCTTPCNVFKFCIVLFVYYNMLCHEMLNYCIVLFAAGEEVDLVGDVFDPHTVAGLLKLHFREMRVSLIARGQTMAEAVQAVQKKQVMTVMFHNYCVITVVCVGERFS